jgi:hypothetical protein
MNWSQIVATVDLPDVKLDEATRARMAAHIERIERQFWEALSYQEPPAEPPTPRCKCRGIIHDFNCFAWST